MTCFALAGREDPHMALTTWDSSRKRWTSATSPG